MSALSQSALPSYESSKDSKHLSPVLTKIAEDQKEMLQFFSQTSGNKIQGMCRFGENFVSLFPLFRSLLIAGRPAGLNISFLNEEKTAFFHYPSENKEEVSFLFDRVIALLTKEVKFKLILKEVIANRIRFKTEQVLLHQALFDKTTY